MAEILKKIGDKAKSVMSSLKSIPPGDSEAQGIAENQKQVDALSAKPAAAKEEPHTEETRTPDPLARYGTRPGEKRLDTSYTDTPSAIKAPVYDKGGDVSMEASRRLQAEGDSRINSLLSSASPTPVAQETKDTGRGMAGYGDLRNYMKDQKDAKLARITTDDSGGVKQPTYMVGGGSSSAAPSMNYGMTAMKLYDEGGDVDVNDGKHQVAILKEGEKVLTPEEADQYRKEHGEEEHGAPAGFPGMVLPNEKGIKPYDSDNPEPKASDTDHLPKGVKSDISNAPLKTPEGDISNPTAADVKPEQGREVSTKTLKPYSQVVEEKAKEKAKEHVENPNPAGQPSMSDVEGKVEERPQEEPRKHTYGDLLAQHWLQSNGLVPPAGVPPAPINATPGPEDQRKAPGLNPIVTPPPAAPPVGKEAFKAKMAQYDKSYQEAMDKAAQTNDPQYREQAGRIKEAKLEYEKAHPWGSPESAHPGVLGKLGHIGEQVASRMPILGINQIAATIPGSEGYRNEEQKAAEEQTKEGAAENTAEQTANAKETKAAGGADKYTLKEIVDQRPDSPTKGQTIYAGVNNTDPTDVRYTPLQAAAKPGAGADKVAFQSVLKKIGTAEVADPAQQKAALDTAHKSGVISDDEYKGAMAFLGSTANAPATQATAKEETRVAGKMLYFDTPTGRKAFTSEQAKAEGLDPAQGISNIPASQVEKDREKNSTYRIIKSALSQYQGHIDTAQLTPNDITTMTTITEDAEKPDYLSKLMSGAFDAMLGHPITGYSEKLMKGTLTKNQWQDMTPPARQLVADYYTTMMAHFANMKASQGTIPRNPVIIQTEMHTIPKPFLSPEEAKPAFQNYQDQVQMRNSENVEFGGANKKEAAPTEQPGVPPEATHLYRDKNNNVVGYALDGKYHELVKQ